jgi:hypothetical protein
MNHKIYHFREIHEYLWSFSMRNHFLRRIPVLFGIFFIILSSTTLVTGLTIKGEIEQEVSIRLDISVLDIDQTKRHAIVKIVIFVEYYPLNFSDVDVSITGSGNTIIFCHNVYPWQTEYWNYQGESDEITCRLDGRGETFPFDSYKLSFKVDDIKPWLFNFSLNYAEVVARFSGEKVYFLCNEWSNTYSHLLVAEKGENYVIFQINRSQSAIIIAVLEFLAPIILCYYLLGATLLIDPKKDLEKRLTIYLSIFVFAPTFLFSIREFLPYRSSLAFPEFLLINLIISNIVFMVSSIIGPEKKRYTKSEKEIRMWDLTTPIAASLIFALFHLIATIISFSNVITIIIITYAITPSYFYIYFFQLYFRISKDKRSIFLSQHRRRIWRILILYFFPLLFFITSEVVYFAILKVWYPLF